MPFRASSQTLRAAGVGTTLTGSAPAGTAANDYLAAFVVLDGVTADTVTPPSGWTSRGSFGFAAGVPDGSHVEVFDKIATGSDSYAFSTNVNNACVMLIGAWSGRNTLAPRTFLTVATPDTTGNASPVSIALTSGTAVAGDDVAVFAMLDITVGTDTWGYTAPGSYTEQNDAQTTFATACLDTRDAVSAGAIGTLTVTGTRSAGTGVAGWGGVVISIAAGSAGSWSRPGGPGNHPGARRFPSPLRGYPVAATTSAIEGAAAAITVSAAQLAGAGALLGSAVHTTTSAGVLAGSGSLAGAVVSGVVAAGNLKGTANAAGAAITAAISAGQLTGQGALLGAAVTATLAAGVASGAGALSGAAVANVIVAGLLADFSPANLVGASVVGAFAAGALSGAGALTGAAAVSVMAAGQLSASGLLTGASIAGSFAAGLLSAQDAGAITASSISFVVASGELISLTPAIPDVVAGSGRGSKRTSATPLPPRQAEDRMLDALTRDMEFENPVFNVPRETLPPAVIEPPRVFTADLTPAVVEILAARDATRRRVLALLLLMAQMND